MSSRKIEQTEENPILVSNEIRMKDNDNADEDEKKRAIENEEKEMADNASHTFPITVLDLEDLMGKYKERGADCLDLKAIESLGGIETLLQKLKTNSKKEYLTSIWQQGYWLSNSVQLEERIEIIKELNKYAGYIIIISYILIIYKSHIVIYSLLVLLFSALSLILITLIFPYFALAECLFLDLRVDN